MWKDIWEGLSDKVVEGTIKFEGGNLMMWGCMTWEGIGYSTRIESKMDADLYCDILREELRHRYLASPHQGQTLDAPTRGDSHG